MKMNHEQCPACESHSVETIEPRSFRLVIIHDRKCLACGAVWRPPASPWLLLAGGLVLFALGGWTLYGGTLHWVSFADANGMAIAIGIVAIMIGIWLAWLWFRSQQQAHASPTLLQSGDQLPLPRDVETRKRQRTERPTRNWWESRWAQLGYVAVVAFVFLVGNPPKDDQGRPKQLERYGPSLRWAEDPSVPSPQQSKPSNPSFDNIRKILEASKKPEGESKPDTATDPDKKNTDFSESWREITSKDLETLPANSEEHIDGKRGSSP